MPRAPRGKRQKGPDGITVAGKAANGEGSVYFEGDRWRATWYGSDGKRRTASGPTREKAIARRDVRMAAEGAPTSSTFNHATTVAQLAAWWLQYVARHRVRPSSLGRYEDRVNRITATIGHHPAILLRPEQVAEWQSDLLTQGLASKTVADVRTTLRQVLATGVDHGLLAANVVDRTKAPKVTTRPTKALAAEQARALIRAASEDKYGAAVALLFVQGWRVSEVLGLAWSDINFNTGTATVERAAVYVDGQGMTLGEPKTEGAHGVHHLAPGVLALLERRREHQADERRAVDEWQVLTYKGRPMELVFTTRSGGVVNRQAITKVIHRAAEQVGIDPATISTHTGRRTVVTTLYSEEGIDLADVARHVGHASPATTAGYVKDLGSRPRATAEAAARQLDV